MTTLFPDDHYVAENNLLTNLDIKSEYYVEERVDNQEIQKTFAFNSAMTQSKSNSCSINESGFFLSAPATVELNANTNENMNDYPLGEISSPDDSPFGEITTVTFPLSSVSPIFTVGSKGNSDSYDSKVYRNSNTRSSSSGGVLNNKNIENTTGSKYCRGTGKFLKGRIVPSTVTTATAATTITAVTVATTAATTAPTTAAATVTITTSAHIKTDSAADANVLDGEMMRTTANITTVSADRPYCIMDSKSDSTSTSLSTSASAIIRGIKVEDDTDSYNKDIMLCTSVVPSHSSYSYLLSVPSETSRKVNLFIFTMFVQCYIRYLSTTSYNFSLLLLIKLLLFFFCKLSSVIMYLFIDLLNY